MVKIKIVLVISIVIFFEQLTFGQLNDTLYKGSCGTILKSDITLKSNLQKIDLQQYNGKTVYELLQNQTIKQYINYGYFIDESTGEIESVTIIFAPGLQISIKVKHLNYTKNFISTLSFDFELFKKEIITSLELDATLFNELISNNSNKTNCKTANIIDK